MERKNNDFSCLERHSPCLSKGPSPFVRKLGSRCLAPLSLMVAGWVSPCRAAVDLAMTFVAETLRTRVAGMALDGSICRS